MVKRDVEADLQEIQRSLPPSPVNWEAIEQTLTQSALLKSQGLHFTQLEPSVWKLHDGKGSYTITFNPELFGEKPSLRLMAWGDPLFHRLLDASEAYL